MSTAGRDFLGPFRVVRILRVSRTAEIAEVIEQSSGERFVLKLLQDRVRTDQTQIDALKFEAEVGASLDHPNVIHILRYAVDRNTPYIVLEYFTSTNLKQVLRGGGHERIAPFIPSIIEQAAAGLQHVHEKGWIHRDVKPDNLLVGETGVTKLIDFSIAQPRYSGFGAWLAGITGGAAREGTRSYMAPEQIRGEVVDPTADVYSFGCTVFELVTGKLPFTATNDNELLNKHLKSAPPTAQINNNVTPEFAALVQKTMAKDKAQRPQSMGEFLEAMSKIKVYKKTLPKPATLLGSADADPAP